MHRTWDISASSKHSNIVLTGFMGTGKTEVGRELSRKLGWRLIDLDEEIEKVQASSIQEIFSRFGEPFFRDLETKQIRKFAVEEHVIISTGGGAVIRQENLDILSQKGLVVNLSATPETILQRTGPDDNRPLLRVEDRLKRIRELLDFRKPFYEKADMVVDTESKTPREVADEILDRIGWK
jgi:shikimate kinase